MVLQKNLAQQLRLVVGKNARSAKIGAADEANNLGAATLFALSFLEDRAHKPSTALTNLEGRKKEPCGDALYVGVNGKFIRAKDFNPDAVLPDAEIVIGSVNVCNRKIDVPLAGDETLSFSIRSGLFDNAVDAIQSRYRAVVEAKHVHMTGGIIGCW